VKKRTGTILVPFILFLLSSSLAGKDKITVQLSNAENLRVPYLIIIGQKEALDDTATIRNTITRAQDTIKIVDLPHYLKNITL